MTITEDNGDILVRLERSEAAELEYADRWERLQASIRSAVEYLEERDKR